MMSSNVINVNGNSIPVMAELNDAVGRVKQNIEAATPKFEKIGNIALSFESITNVIEKAAGRLMFWWVRRWILSNNRPTCKRYSMAMRKLPSGCRHKSASMARQRCMTAAARIFLFFVCTDFVTRVVHKNKTHHVFSH